MFAKEPRIFTIAPPLEKAVNLNPETWRASFFRRESDLISSAHRFFASKRARFFRYIRVGVWRRAIAFHFDVGVESAVVVGKAFERIIEVPRTGVPYSDVVVYQQAPARSPRIEEVMRAIRERVLESKRSSIVA